MLKSAPLQTRAVPGAGDEDLARLLLAAVDVARRTLAASQNPPGTDAAPALIADKVRNESAMLLRSLWDLRDDVPGLATALSQLADDLATADPVAFAIRLCLHPGIALDLALVPIHLRDLGLGDPRLEPFLASVLDDDRPLGPERPAHRRLETEWLHGLWSGRVNPTALADTLRATSLAWEFDHLSGTTDDAYAFTHAVLYATDHGRRNVPLPRAPEQIEADADAILAVALDAGNHDVAAEVLWTWPMLRIPWSPLAAETWRFLADVAAQGFLPGPGFDPSIHDRLPAAERDAYVLQTSYHTTLVHGMLVAAVMTGAPPTPAPSLLPTECDLVTDLTPPLTVSRDWWSHVDGLSAARRRALGPAFVTMALRRAVVAADIPGLARIAREAAQRGIPETPALRQAHRLLANAVACARLAE